jgi:hypothetical protein
MESRYRKSPLELSLTFLLTFQLPKGLSWLLTTQSRRKGQPIKHINFFF